MKCHHCGGQSYRMMVDRRWKVRYVCTGCGRTIHWRR